jgi:hypothetical protein
MGTKLRLAAAFVAVIAATTYCCANADEKQTKSELEESHKSTIDKAVKEMSAGKGLASKKVPHGGANTYGKVLDLRPSGDVPSGDVTIEMDTELYAGQNSPNSVLFVEYLFVIDLSNNQLILKVADSILLSPGTGICGVPSARLNNLHPGEYRIVGRITTRNSDGSETIRDEKTTKFRVS